MNGFHLMKQRYSSMSPAEKKIADYILEDPERAAGTTIVCLAREAGVSPGSISNFAGSLGFSGFAQLKLNLARNLGETEAKEEEKLEKPLLRGLMESARSSFESTFQTVSEEAFYRAAKEMIQAKRILLVGFAFSAPVAQDIAFRVMSLGLPAQAMTDALAASVACSHLDGESILFVISTSGRTKDALNCARTAKLAGAKVFCFTSYARNPLVELSDQAFVAVANEAYSYRESMTARLTQLMMGDYLVEILADLIGPRAVERFDSVVDVIEKNREALPADEFSEEKK